MMNRRREAALGAVEVALHLDAERLRLEQHVEVVRDEHEVARRPCRARCSATARMRSSAFLVDSPSGNGASASSGTTRSVPPSGRSTPSMRLPCSDSSNRMRLTSRPRNRRSGSTREVLSLSSSPSTVSGMTTSASRKAQQDVRVRQQDVRVQDDGPHRVSIRSEATPRSRGRHGAAYAKYSVSVANRLAGRAASWMTACVLVLDEQGGRGVAAAR